MKETLGFYGLSDKNRCL